MKDKERWMELCKQASTEQDSKKLAMLVREITRLLEEKSSRIRREEVGPDGIEQENHASPKPRTLAPTESEGSERGRPSEAHESDRRSE